MVNTMKTKMIFAIPALFAAPVFAQNAEPWTLSDEAHAIVFKADVPAGEGIALLLDPEGLGTTVYRLVFSSDGKVRSDIAIEYSPVTIRMTAPYYRDCVFESMKLKRLEGEKKSVRRVVLMCCRDHSGAYQVESGWIEADGVKLADFTRGASGVVEVPVRPAEVSRLAIRLRGKNLQYKNSAFTKATPWLSEVEVY